MNWDVGVDRKLKKINVGMEGGGCGLYRQNLGDWQKPGTTKLAPESFGILCDPAITPEPPPPHMRNGSFHGGGGSIAARMAKRRDR